ncbi:MAG: hypothetical protein ACREUW_17390 [Burkholderiales bacterium]
MGALGHYLEAEGIATTQISLVREHTAAINPPRALWVPFILGRPFGVPGDAAFQMRVLKAALHLLTIKAGPALVDYLEEAPAPAAEDTAGMVCPVSFGSGEATDLPSRFTREVEDLAQWYDLAVQRRGRTTVGLSGFTAAEAARYVISYLGATPAPVFREGLSAGDALKLVTEDLRAYYFEAAGAQPGAPRAADLARWFWHDTAAGRLFVELQKAGKASSDESVRQFVTRTLIPRAVGHALGLEVYTTPASENVAAQ